MPSSFNVCLGLAKFLHVSDKIAKRAACAGSLLKFYYRSLSLTRHATMSAIRFLDLVMSFPFAKHAFVLWLVFYNPEQIH